MKKLEILRYVLVFFVLILIIINIWTNSLKAEDSKTYNLLTEFVANNKQIKLEYHIVSNSMMYTVDEDGKESEPHNDFYIYFQRKNNGDISVEQIDTYENTKMRWIWLSTSDSYIFIDDINKYYTTDYSGMDLEILHHYNPYDIDMNNIECTHRAYEFLDGKLYYVESFKGIYNTSDYSIKFYYYNDKLAFFGSSNDRIYIEKYSSQIDESVFSLNIDGYDN